MANTFFGLSIAQSGLYAANIALNTTAHNVSNEQTKGYSRQHVVQEAGRPIQVYQKYGMVGAGVNVKDIEQIRDAYYDYKYWNNNAKVGEYETLYNHMLTIEDYFNEIKTEGFTEEYNGLFNTLSSLKDDPSSYAARTNVVGFATNLLEYFDTIKANLVNNQEDINEEIKDKVDKINVLATDIAALNQQINIVEITGETANDLRDRRNLLVDELSSIVEVSVSETQYENQKTDYRLLMGGNTLVDNYTSFELMVESREEKHCATDAVGLYDIKWSWGDVFDPVGDDYKGELKSLIQVRDGDNQASAEPIDYKGIPYYITEINKFLENFTKAFNDIHKDGYNLNGDKISDLENSDFFICEDGVYKVNSMYVEEPALMGLSDSPIQNGQENSGILEKLMDIENARMYDGGTSEDFVQALITEIAIDARKAKTLHSNYDTMKKAINNQRMSISGVDTDEEAMNLMKYQEAYELASHVISVMNEIYSKMINEMGL